MWRSSWINKFRLLRIQTSKFGQIYTGLLWWQNIHNNYWENARYLWGNAYYWLKNIQRYSLKHFGSDEISPYELDIQRQSETLQYFRNSNGRNKNKRLYRKELFRSFWKWITSKYGIKSSTTRKPKCRCVISIEIDVDHWNI